MTSIFEGQPPQNKALSIQNEGHLGSRYVWYCMYTGKLTWNLKITCLKRKIIVQIFIFGGSCEFSAL